jgi:glycosyltransferase involved in cell wall biosynthesis
MPSTDPRLHILVVGQLVARKGIRQLFDALCAAPEVCPRIEVRFAGTGSLRGEVEAGIASLAGTGLIASVLGQVSSEALPGIYAWGDVLLFPSLDDEWGVVVNEAMAAGLAVVGSRYAGAAVELIQEGDTGWLFDPLEATAFANVLRRIALTPRDVFRRMGERGRGMIAGFSHDAAYRNLVAAVQCALGAKTNTS